MVGRATRTRGAGGPALLGAAALAALCADAGAHHAIGRIYDSANRVTIEGVVTEFRFVNPHPLVIVDVTNDAGVAESWQLEMDNRFELAQVGMTEETFEPGDRVVATGSANRTRARSLYLRRLDRPLDGLRYEQRGSRPSLDPGDG